MNRHLYTVLLLLVSVSVNAEIYKGVDAEGNVTFSDKETPDAELIPMPSPNTVKMPEALPRARVAEEEKSTTYESFKIVKPKTNATVRDSNGNIDVTMELTPALDTEAGHRIDIYVNGKPVIKGSSALSAQLTNINRGSTGVKAFVKNKKNKTLISSNKVIVHLKRLSELHPKTSGPTIGPVDVDGNPINPNTNKPGPTNPDGSSIKPGPQNPAYTPGPIIPPPAP